MTQSQFLGYLMDQLAPLDGVSWKAMFGGVGLYRHGFMFGIVADDVLYLKADSRSRPASEARGLEAFSYLRRGRRIAMSYHRAPDDALDDAEALQAWVRRACSAAVGARK